VEAFDAVELDRVDRLIGFPDHHQQCAIRRGVRVGIAIQQRAAAARQVRGRAGNRFTHDLDQFP
jgi:hypothetical protein